jgi:hypothetical protein
MNAKSGDTIYFANKFVKVQSYVKESNYYELDEWVHGLRWWIIPSPIVVSPDTPQNRLAIQLKYA